MSNNNLQCHSGTTKDEILAFVNEHKGKLIKVLYETNISNFWGDDYEVVIDTSEEKGRNQLLYIIEYYYIHSLTTTP